MIKLFSCMSLEITIPMGNKTNIKNLVFSILTHEYPLKLIELTNYIKKRYGKTTTFQAVRKATLLLVEEGVLKRDKNEFSINIDWIKESKTKIDKLYEEIINKKQKETSVDSIGEEVSVFSFESLNDLMKFWQELIDDWFKKFKKGNYPINCWQGQHLWEFLIYPETEEKIMSQMKKKGIKAYQLIINNTILDRYISKSYNKIGVKTTNNKSNSSFDKSYCVATYGDLIVQTTYPEKIVKELDKFFKEQKTIENLDLPKLIKIVKQKIPMKLTVIKNLAMAKQINKTIIEQIE